MTEDSISIKHFCVVLHDRENQFDLKGMSGIRIMSTGERHVTLFVSGYGAEGSRPTWRNFMIGARNSAGDGLFARVSVNETCVNVYTDVISSVPIFYFEDSKQTVISSSLKTLIVVCQRLGCRLCLDMDSCSEVMMSSYVFTRGKTLVNGVERMLPNYVLTLTLSNSSLSVKRYREDWKYGQQSRPWEACIEDMYSGLIQGMESYKGKRVAVMLSGGADSRIVAAAAVEAGLEPDFYTFGQSTVNDSDFSIASNIAYALKRPLQTFTATSLNFRKNWKAMAQISNWSDMWNLAKLPRTFFEEQGEYDVVFRGDGDGIYGWKGSVGSVTDILHRLEITPIEALIRHGGWFEDARDVFSAGDCRRKKLLNKYSERTLPLSDLKNICYLRHREYGCIAQNLWVMSNWMVCDAPLLSKRSMDVAASIPPRYRNNKQLIFAVLKRFKPISEVPFAGGGSWDDMTENWMTGVTGELIEYVSEWSPWTVNYEILQRTWDHPSRILVHTISNILSSRIRSRIQNVALVRKIAFASRPSLVTPTFSSRGLARLAVISNLNETLSTGVTE